MTSKYFIIFLQQKLSRLTFITLKWIHNRKVAWVIYQSAKILFNQLIKTHYWILIFKTYYQLNNLKTDGPQVDQVE
jgi:hypothetical protein